MTIRGWARSRGIPATTAQRAVESGRVPLRPDGKVNPRAADREWQATRRARLAAGGRMRPRPMAESRRRREAAHAARMELLVAKLRGELVEWAAVEQAAGNVFRRARTIILGAAPRVADALAASGDPGECRRILDVELRRVCEQVATPDVLAPPRK